VELEEIKEALRLERTSAAGGSYMAFFKTRGNLLRFFIILAVGFFSQWSGNGLISVSCARILNQNNLSNIFSVLLDAHSRLDRLHFTRNPNPHQRYSHDLESGHVPLFLALGQQVQTPNYVLDFDCFNVSLFRCLDCLGGHV